MSAAIEEVQAQVPISAEIQRLLQPGVTLGGARPKALLQTDAGPCVIKFSELGDSVDTPLVEHATMTLAALAGINVATTGVLPLPPRHGMARHALTIERFDRMGGFRLHCLSAKTALRAAQLPESYAALASVLLRLGVLLAAGIAGPVGLVGAFFAFLLSLSGTGMMGVPYLAPHPFPQAPLAEDGVIRRNYRRLSRQGFNIWQDRR